MLLLAAWWYLLIGGGPLLLRGQGGWLTAALLLMGEVLTLVANTLWGALSLVEPLARIAWLCSAAAALVVVMAGLLAGLHRKGLGV